MRLPNSHRILVELPGVKEPQRVRDLLQGTASLEFWLTYDAREVLPALAAADKFIKAELSEAPAAKSPKSLPSKPLPPPGLPQAKPRAFSPRSAPTTRHGRDRRSGTQLRPLRRTRSSRFSIPVLRAAPPSVRPTRPTWLP